MTSRWSALLFCVTAAGAQDLRPSNALHVLPLHAETHHVQGIAGNADTLWVTSVDRPTRRGLLFAFSRATGTLIRSIEIQQGDRYHPGGFSHHNCFLWIPVAEYRRNSTAVIQKRNARTFALEFEFPVDDHIGCLAVTPEHIIGGNWDSRDFYLWTHTGKLIRKVPNPSGNGIQDMKYSDGQLIAGGLLADKTGAIDWLSLPDFKPLRRVTAGRTDRNVNFTQEGLAVVGGQLWLLPEDGPSRLFVFPLPVPSK